MRNWQLKDKHCECQSLAPPHHLVVPLPTPISLLCSVVKYTMSLWNEPPSSTGEQEIDTPDWFLKEL